MLTCAEVGVLPSCWSWSAARLLRRSVDRPKCRVRAPVARVSKAIESSVRQRCSSSHWSFSSGRSWGSCLRIEGTVSLREAVGRGPGEEVADLVAALAATFGDPVVDVLLVDRAERQFVFFGQARNFEGDADASHEVAVGRGAVTPHCARWRARRSWNQFRNGRTRLACAVGLSASSCSSQAGNRSRSSWRSGRTPVCTRIWRMYCWLRLGASSSRSSRLIGRSSVASRVSSRAFGL